MCGKLSWNLWTGVFLSAVGLAALATPARKPPATPQGRVSYDRDIKPLLTDRCYACHGNGVKLGDFAIDSREGILTGGSTHPVVVPGQGARSYLIKMVSGQIPGQIMPARGPRLSPAQIGLLRDWIDQGLPFGASQSAALWKTPLAPRRPKVPPAPAGSGLTNPIDLLLQPYFRAHKNALGAVVDDRTYARRVSLDITGLLPSPAGLAAFQRDTRPDKRARLAERLLADNDGYATHWLTFWNDLLRNDYAGTGYIDGGRTQITGWLLDALRHNMPYDQFVSQLVNPSAASAGFVKGIVWRGTVNAAQTPAMQAAQNISQVFLGVNLKCASCHNSFISNWKLADAYGMAGIYADGPLEMVRCDKPTGQTAPIKFLYPTLGRIDGAAPPEKRQAQLASVLTCRANGRLGRTFVNRLWTRLLGRGLVEPNDDMDSRPWDPDLLDWLASDFADHGYDVKRTIALIVTSRAYQTASVAQPTERSDDFTFRGPVVKRLTAEQFSDAVSTLTGVWPASATPTRISGDAIRAHGGTIRFQSGLLKSGSVTIDVDVRGVKTLSLIATNDGASDRVDDDWVDWVAPTLTGPQGETDLTSLKWTSATTGYGEVQVDKNIVSKPLRLGDTTYAGGIGTHAVSVITYALPLGVTRFRATAGPDTGGVEEGKGKAAVQLFVVTDGRPFTESRAALAQADPLTRALGRPNREQVVTERLTAATTLQALELTNGRTLAASLRNGAARWTQDPAKTPTQIVNGIYRQALGRPPTAAERQMALGLVGSPVRKEGVEDLLWAVVMLPEFQLIY